MRVRCLRFAGFTAITALFGCGGGAALLGCSESGGSDPAAKGGSAGGGGSSGSGAAGTGGGTAGSGGSGGASGVCEGDRMVNRDADFDALVLEGCESIGGDLQISQLTKPSLAGLERLKSVGRDFRLINNGSLTSLNGLQGLTTVGRDLNVTNAGMANLSGLENVVSVGGQLAVTVNSELTSLSPLENWPSDAVGGSIAIQFNPQLPQCQVDAFDAAQANAACTEILCTANRGTGTCQ